MTGILPTWESGRPTTLAASTGADKMKGFITYERQGVVYRDTKVSVSETWTEVCTESCSWLQASHLIRSRGTHWPVLCFLAASAPTAVQARVCLRPVLWFCSLFLLESKGSSGSSMRKHAS